MINIDDVYETAQEKKERRKGEVTINSFDSILYSSLFYELQDQSIESVD